MRRQNKRVLGVLGIRNYREKSRVVEVQGARAGVFSRLLRTRIYDYFPL